MTLVRFTPNLRRHVDCDAAEVSGARTVRDALERCFVANPRLRGYVLDEHGALRHHMMVLVDGRHVADRAALGDPVHDSSAIDVVQALSGG